MSESDDKKGLESYGWERLETSYPYTYRMFRVREDLVRWPDGHVAPYCYVQADGAVWVVAVTAEQELVLIRQLRYTSADWYWELVAGGFHDFEGDPLDLAKRELAEEAGGQSDDWEYVGWFRPGTSILDEICHIVLARSVRLDLEPDREAGELIEVHLVPIDQGLEMARSGEMVDGHSALALLRCEPYLTGERE